ncbi:four-helix bundle copper-binding protein [Antarcticibacterium sp. 1MA-6-2]|uniref:four-helix bundle copper-binding protein n=1 Tax=Antarcticibacterium sp. 1MA-6-2 TaxID=2908210 RepID=UPI001F25E615|nr:four-helix bundle copper-binding protein [Antarcticibacterium sp. 1MA-6-2]
MRNERLIHALGNCINHCNYCADACLGEENVKMMVDCIRTDRVCAEVCSTVNQVIITNFKNVQGLLDYCIEICEACAKECEKHEHQHCKDCAKACRECAEACRNYAA